MVNTNLASIDATTNLNKTTTSLSMAEQRLSSGLRINSAADDVAGYGISQSLQAQVNGLSVATQNSQDAIALAQTGQGALNDVEQMLQRIRELAVQFANGTTSTEGKESIENETTQLKEEIKRVGETTEFNGTKLLEKEKATEITFQVGANAGKSEQISIKIVELTAEKGLAEVHSVVATESKTLLEEAEGKDLTKVSKAIAEVAKAAGEFGAVQDRVQYAQANTEVYGENLESAKAALTNVNMASEMTNFTNLQVLQQAGVAILAQANAQPQSVLKLLG